MRPCFAGRLLEQRIKELPRYEPQQEQSGQPEQQRRFSCGVGGNPFSASPRVSTDARVVQGMDRLRSLVRPSLIGATPFGRRAGKAGRTEEIGAGWPVGRSRGSSRPFFPAERRMS